MSDEIRDIIGFLSGIPLPASVVSGGGEVIFINDVMAGVMGGATSGEKMRCEWIDRQENSSCPDCSERPTLQGRCFIPRNASASISLLAAIRLPFPQSALIRVYSDNDEDSAILYEEIMFNLLQRTPFVSRFRSARSASLTDDDLLLRAPLAGMVDMAVKTPKLGHMKIENKTDPLQTVRGASPIILRRVVQNILLEADNLTFSGPVHIESKTRGGQNTGLIEHILSFRMSIGHAVGKRMSSELMAMALRLRLFSKNMTAATGFETEPPVVLCDGAMVEIQFIFPDFLKKTGAAVSFSYQHSSGDLSAREKEVAEMARAGLSNEKISRLLGISAATVKQHLKSIYRKEGVKSRIELIFKDAPPA